MSPILICGCKIEGSSLRNRVGARSFVQNWNACILNGRFTHAHSQTYQMGGSLLYCTLSNMHSQSSSIVLSPSNAYTCLPSTLVIFKPFVSVANLLKAYPYTDMHPQDVHYPFVILLYVIYLLHYYLFTLYFTLLL